MPADKNNTLDFIYIDEGLQRPPWILYPSEFLLDGYTEKRRSMESNFRTSQMTATAQMFISVYVK